MRSAIVTEWKTFRAPDFMQSNPMLKAAIIFDGRNLPEAGDNEGSSV